MPEELKTSMSDTACEDCEYRELPKDSGFCYSMCLVGKNRHKQPKKSIAATLLLVGVALGRK